VEIFDENMEMYLNRSGKLLMKNEINLFLILREKRVIIPSN
jgi:hypothetical protein